MEKKKSNKKINKTVHVGPKRQQQPKMPMQTIMKEIGELKKELVSIKSKKYLNLSERQDNHMQHQSKQKTYDNFNREMLTPTVDNFKENTNRCDCRYSSSAKKQKPQQSKKKQIKIEFFPITAPKSRQTKLKFSIQFNKIKSTLEKIYSEAEQNQSVQVVVAELNSTALYMNSIIKQYEDQILGKREQFKEMKEQLSELSKKIIKLSEKHSTQRHMGEAQIEEIAELKRHLSYYMSLMKDNKDEAEKYSKEFTDLQAYAKELENNNQLLRAQIKLVEEKYTETSAKLKQNESSHEKIIKQLALIQSDLHLSRTELDKNREKRRDVQKLNEKLKEQLEEARHKLSSKQRAIVKANEDMKELQKTIQGIKIEQKNMVVGLTNKKLQIQKLEKHNTILELTLQEKERVQGEKDEEIQILRQRLESQIKQNKKNASNLEFCQLEINSLSEEVDQLRRANERYKNQHFRNKLIHPHENDSARNQAGDRTKNVNVKNKLFEEETALKSQSKNRKKILGEIQDLISKHRKSSDSESESEQN